MWPVINRIHSINHPFREKRSYGLHEGVDLYARAGDPIVACLDGVVVWASNQRRSGGDSDYGNHIIVRHGLDDVWATWYAHLQYMVSGVGDVVKRGDRIGEAGSTGNSTGPHLHLTVQHIGHGLDGFVVPDVVDPEEYL